MFSKAKIQEMMAKFAKVNVADIQDADLRAKAAQLKKKQGGFTLLELLVVVAILAAIAGTATVALQDTDARASAAAHVAMMDEINKGVRTFRALNKAFPDTMDSLLQANTGFATNAEGDAVLSILAAGDIALSALDADTVGILNDVGITNHRVVYGDATGPDGGPTAAALTCDIDADGTLTSAELQSIINSRSNQTVAGLIYQNGNTGDDTGGCGATHTLADGSAVAIWTGGSERLTGVDAGTVTAGATFADLVGDVADTPVFMAVGVGANSSLFDTTNLSGMTSVPVYRHVAKDEYNRFIALFQVGTVGTAAGSYAAAEQVLFTAVVDGAGDTKEEELGEWDGTRNTI